MLVDCPECDKKNISRTDQAIRSHVYKSNAHKGLTKTKKDELYHKMMPRIEVGAGFLSRDKSSRELEKSLTFYLNR